MFVGITNTPRDYAWGSTTAIAELLGTTPSGGPEAELWFGAHRLSPSRILDPASVGGYETLDAWIAADPDTTLGVDRSDDRLSFLLKVLAADAPLSIQAHPSTEQAEEGFAREDEAGVPLDSSDRNYKDRLAKPELTLALSPTFEVLAGFREIATTRMLVAELVATATVLSEKNRPPLEALGRVLAGEDPLKNAVEWGFDGSDSAAALIAAIAETSDRMPSNSSFAREYATLADLGRRHPGDPGILVALLLNRISIAQGRSVYLPARNVHAYLEGLAVEIMGASDNVLRGGLTPKHVDSDELVRVVRWDPLPPPLFTSEEVAPGVEVFRPDVPDFALARIAVGDAGALHGYQNTGAEFAEFAPRGPAIVLVTEGELAVEGARSSTTIRRGEAVFVTPDEEVLRFSGSGIAFVASANR
ncbi:mannose-6-phosphate isomerase, class I [Amnibacterium flavum]|uniref:mannose-6-phosphate isomerase n=1 Tax=Amnibacterium flavum TaxID=2173173 RepID=A0A2V1HXC3_9MICO|nr:mannose-6-phosphate isomerase, class I [Amnibacterium flavum]PVZ95920.1 mannose-6-phosphate isomerase, class I [Amnibacterium flavum]